ncbi:Cysteine-rich receptor-like protein kinase [Thalictrum thalictroides]|uniref:Cysteine-rich receptor-like protein kinase n=1 Tax=Thalictrum thalictroides TaxID=46969 RepID=A0A7J6VW58_THATH|nr:Cysteine-rich receptor-like protein kinase [Thalictrum thalictroides]
MEGITKLVDKQGWGIIEDGSNPTLYSLAQCMNDLSHTDCLLCFTEARTKLPRCIPSVSARVHLDGCFLRWDNYSFYQESIDDKLDRRVCNTSAASTEDYLKLEFTSKAKEVIANVTSIASKDGFAVAESKRGVVSVYALAQCWKTVNSTGCQMCLEKAAKEVNQCLPGREGRALNTGCYLRYSTEMFYSDGELKKDDNGFLTPAVIVAIVVAGIAFIMLSIFGGCLAYKQFVKMKKERKSLGRLSTSVSKSNLNFKYETLEKATDFFNPSRKLGQGGAGSVFKGTLPDGKDVAVKRLFFNTRQWVDEFFNEGTLPDGKDVAVKRLFFNTRQWVDEFFNEVNLISGIKHKNLVQLLGCSIEGPESLLVYEYVVNKSLDHVLFADFGLARDFAPDKSHLSTGIAGTLGYMAPEYLVRGQLTEKADVYSFGVLLLEIVCGRKNTVFTPESGSVLQTVWKHYKSNSLPESIDPALRGDFPITEASNVLQVGLLCTQASVSIRPSMSQVLQMLTDREYTIPLPMQPPFLNASVMNPDSSTMSKSASTRAMDTSKSYSMSSSPSAPSTVEINQAR